MGLSFSKKKLSQKIPNLNTLGIKCVSFGSFRIILPQHAKCHHQTVLPKNRNPEKLDVGPVIRWKIIFFTFFFLLRRSQPRLRLIGNDNKTEMLFTECPEVFDSKPTLRFSLESEFDWTHLIR